jgi:hypothetical protein
MKKTAFLHTPHRMAFRWVTLAVTAPLLLGACTQKEHVTLDPTLPMQTHLLDGYWKQVTPYLPEWASGYTYVHQNALLTVTVVPRMFTLDNKTDTGAISPFTDIWSEIGISPFVDYDSKSGYYIYNNTENMDSETIVNSLSYQWFLIGSPTLPSPDQISPKQAPILFTFNVLSREVHCSPGKPLTTFGLAGIRYTLQRLDTGQLYLRKNAATDRNWSENNLPSSPQYDPSEVLKELDGPFNGYWAPDLVQISRDQAPAIIRIYADWYHQHPEGICFKPPEAALQNHIINRSSPLLKPLSANPD